MVQRPEKAQQETSFPKASYVRTIAEVVVSSIFFTLIRWCGKASNSHTFPKVKPFFLLGGQLNLLRKLFSVIQIGILRHFTYYQEEKKFFLLTIKKPSRYMSLKDAAGAFSR